MLLLKKERPKLPTKKKDVDDFFFIQVYRIIPAANVIKALLRTFDGQKTVPKNKINKIKG